MSRPVIGITTGRWNVPASDLRRQEVATGCMIEYPACVEQAGGAPLLLPRTDNAEVSAAVMDRADALLLSGGGDILAAAYGAEPHPANGIADPVRDAAEFDATRIALRRGLPILGICRGIQTLNVVMGGTLIQDIPDQVAGACQHAAHVSDEAATHTVDIEPGSVLARVLGTTCLAVNSYHHQAVDRLGEGLRVNCRARDGVVEGIESADGRPILAVQCHPERSFQRCPVFRRRFEWLVAEANGRARR